jgi:glutamate synthase (NADPH/NADH) small chain
MPNMHPEQNPMPEQPPDIRRRNFEEVALGYSAAQALDEAHRCLQCPRKPCTEGCPVGVDIPGFIQCIQENAFAKAYQILRETNSLPAICGRVCPQETQCEQRCVRRAKGQSVAIGRLERFAADHAPEKGYAQDAAAPAGGGAAGMKTAVIGSGPASLACAGDLRKAGCDVTVYEALHAPGGVLRYGIPEFRLPKTVVEHEIGALIKMGVRFVTNFVTGKTLTVNELMREEGYRAVFIGVGAGLPVFLQIPGENACGVYSANEFLTRINLMKGYLFPQTATPVSMGRRIAVVGGGNVAMDAARCAVRLNADEVSVIYRRSLDEMPARLEEIRHAEEEGVLFRYLSNPVEILADSEGSVTGIRLVKMELGAPDASGRRRPAAVPGSEFTLNADTVIIAIGNSPNPLIGRSTEGLMLRPDGGIVADETTCATSLPGVFAGGDAVSGAATVILAMGAGKRAAEAMVRYLQGE